MTWDRNAYTAEEWEKVNQGELCPNSNCKSQNTKYVGGNFDGINANAAWDCNICGAQWEGY